MGNDVELTPPIDRPIHPPPRGEWENDDVEVYPTCTPNPVPIHVEPVSGEPYEHGQIVARRLNCLQLWDRGNGRATALRGMLSLFLSF